MKNNKKSKSNLIFYSVLIGVLLFLFATPWGGNVRSWLMSFTLRSPDVTASKVEDNGDAAISLDWMIIGTDNKKVWLSSIDKPIFLNIWATWCGPCRSEMPSIEALQKEYGNSVEFLLVSTTEGIEIIQKFKEAEDIDFKLYANGSAIPKNLYSTVFPTTFIISKQKKIEYKFEGSFNWDTDEVHTMLDNLLK